MNTQQKDNGLDKLRHSAAHLLAAAVLELYPDAKPTIGPAIEDGFYYDFEFAEPISDKDLKAIEKKMKKLSNTWESFEGKEVSADEARKYYKDNPYKLELIDELEKEGATISLYTSGTFTDLCRGGHVDNPNKVLKHFKLLSLAGAYWRGDEKNTMLTRIYGTAFLSRDDLDKHLKMLDEAKKRDHRVIGKKLQLFLFDESSPGMPYWLPNGMIIYNQLLEFWREEHMKRGYQETSTPLVNKSDLWKTSGHWDHYKDDMFIADMGDNEVYGIKPMNCPNAMVIFKSMQVSYRDLPLRFSDADRLHRYELSGTLNGLFRVRSFQQDDSHNFISEDMIESEYKEIFAICERFYSIFDLEYSFRLGTRPKKFMGDKKTWDRAETTLKNILQQSEKDYFIEEGDGAFYGPKVDIIMKDALGRVWQMGTIQLDFQIPRNFELTYTDNDGNEKTPVVIHRVIYGSLERFIGILIEHYAGNFPLWLAPVQTAVLPVSEKHNNIAEAVRTQLSDAGIRVELDADNKTLPSKIRRWTLQKVPYMCIIGDKEAQKSNFHDDQPGADLFVSIRTRDGEDMGMMSLASLIDQLHNDIEKKTTT